MPVMGDLTRPETWADAAAQATLLVHCAADLQAGMVGPDKAAIEGLIAAGPRGPRPKTLIYTSGVWVNGATGDVAADETTPLNPLPIVAWRPAHEQAVLSATTVRGIVLRPGCVYGKSGSMTGAWFEGAYKKKDVSVVGDGRNRWAMVHVDDLAEAYLRVAQSGLQGEIFNVTDRSRAHRGGDGRGGGPRRRLCGKRSLPSPRGGRQGRWGPSPRPWPWTSTSRRGSWRGAWAGSRSTEGFVDGVKTFFEAWKAFQA